MVAAEAPLFLQTHRSEGGSYGPLSRSQDRTCQKQLDMRPDAFGESGAKAASTCTIVVGRVGISRSPLLSELVTSVPYPFRSQMAKVQLRNCLKSLGCVCNEACETTEAVPFDPFRLGILARFTLAAVLATLFRQFQGEVRRTLVRRCWVNSRF